MYVQQLKTYVIVKVLQKIVDKIIKGRENCANEQL